MAKCNFNKSKEVTNPLKVMMEGRTSAKQIYGMVHCSTATGEWQLQQGTGQLRQLVAQRSPYHLRSSILRSLH